MKKILSIVLLATMLFSMFAIPVSATSSTLKGDYQVINAAGVNVRKTASTSGTILRQVSYGYEFRASVIYGVQNNWVKSNTAEEYFSRSYVLDYNSPPPHEKRKVSISSGNLSVREGPSSNAAQIASFANGANITVSGKTAQTSNGHYWELVLINGRAGWVASTYLVNR